MELVRQTPNRLIVVNKRSSVDALVLLFTVVLFLMILLLSYSSGVMELTCQRLPSETITCEKKQSRFFGFTHDQPINIQQVIRAQLLQETYEDDDGDDYQVYQVILLTPTDIVPVTDFSSEYKQKKRITDQVNMFVNSNEPSLLLYYDNRFLDDVIGISFAILCTVIGVVIILLELHSKFLVFDKSMNRLYLKSSITPLWKKQKEYPLPEVRSISITEEKDSDGDTSYKADIILNSGEHLPLGASSKLSDLESACQVIQQEFLRHVTFDYINLEADLPIHQDTKSFLVFEGKYDIYLTRNRSIESMSNSHRRYHQDLLDLGFKFLGDLHLQKIPIVLWGYAHTEADIYSVLYDGSLMPPILDFYSVFLDGASLTTSNLKSWIKDIPERKIYRSFYPSASIQELYNRHSQRLVTLIPKLGSTRSTGGLRDLAISIDNYRSREPSSLGYKLLLYLRPIWSWLMTGRMF